MREVMRTIVMIASVVLMMILQPISGLAMVIAPRCTSIEQQADAYKVITIIGFSVAYYFLAWRRASLFAAVVIPIAQITLGWVFISYLNSLPWTCRQ